MSVEDVTPLNLAILRQNYEKALLLIEYGADVSRRDCFGMTPLHMACMQGNLDVVKVTITFVEYSTLQALKPTSILFPLCSSVP